MIWSSSVSRPGVSVQPDGAFEVHRALPEEVPVAMVYDGTSHAVMMATPADIADFAYGFSLTEGIVTDPGQIDDFEIVEHAGGIEARFWLCTDRREALTARRRFMAGPVGCGLCGLDSLEAAARALPAVPDTGLRFGREDVLQATGALRPWQPLHDRTRATHAAGFLRPGEGIVLAREDVGRHNALDKLIGAMVQRGVDASAGAFVMTSRLSVELVQKCALAGCPALIAVSAPTAHALRLAESAGITLAAFARGRGFDLYSHAHRIQEGVPNVA